MLAGVIFVAQWQRSALGFPGEVNVLRGCSGRPAGTHNPVRHSGVEVL
jgi:hypothetical protein